MTPSRRDAKQQTKAINRRRLNAQERHQHQQRQAQRDIEALRQALDDLGVPDNLVIEIAGRLRAQKKLLGKVFGLMFPTLFGCRSAYELTCVRGWDKHLPSRLLGALPKRSWLTRLRTLGLDVLVPLWRHVASMRPATRSRWQWTWVWDDSVFLMASFVLYYTSRVLFKGHVTMDEMIFNLKHHWSSVDCQNLELYGIS